MKKTKLISRIAAAAITACMLFSNQPWSIAAAEVKQEKEFAVQYVSEVKMFYANTEDEAREMCRKEGFTFCPENLNEGVGKKDSGGSAIAVRQREMGEWDVKSYLGYKTTDDPDEAITDMSLLDMKRSHYEKKTYLEYLDEYAGVFSQKANSIMILVNAFREQYKKGTPNALLAYDSLNLIYVDEEKSSDSPDNQMGNYLLNKADTTFFQKYLQRGNAKILNTIIDLLGSAVTDVRENGETWVDRSKSSEIPKMYANATSADRNAYDTAFRDSARTLIEAVRDFSTIYYEAKSLYDQYGETLGYEQLSADSTVSDMMELGSDCRYPEYANALQTYALLDAYTYQQAGETVVSDASLLAEGENAEEQGEAFMTVEYQEEKSLADVLLELAQDPDIDNHLEWVYPLVQYMTPAQKTILSLCGLGKLAQGLYMAEEKTPSERSDLIKERMAKIRSEGFEKGRIYLWHGVDTSMYSKKVAETSKAIEVKMAGREYIDAMNAKERKENDRLTAIMRYIEISQLIFSAIYGVATAFTGSLLTIGMNCFTAAGISLSLGSIGAAVASAVIGAFMCVIWALNILGIVLSVALLIYQILQWTGALEPTPEKVDYSTIPDIVFNAVNHKDGKNYRIKYDSVHSSGNIVLFSNPIEVTDELKNYADMNAFLSTHDRWIALYTTKCEEAGDPISVTPGQSLLVTQDNYQAPEGYRPLALFNAVTGEDINDVEILGKKGDPLYVFFPGESDAMASAVHSDSNTFVTDVRLSSGDNEKDARNALIKDGFTIINDNLTEDHGYTYLGYKTGTNEKNALTDLRVSTNGNLAQIKFGDAQYARTDPTGKNGITKDGLALYMTNSPSAGTPITDIKVCDERLPLGSGPEPVCLFSGGNAVDFKGFWSDNMLYNEAASMYDYLVEAAHASYDQTKTYGWQPPEEVIKQDDPVKGKYIYFWPQDQYIADSEDAKAPYVAGFSYFLAAHDKTVDNRYGTNYEFMQKFAKENGFELLMDEASEEPFRAMTSEANEMTVTTYMVEAEGTPTLTYHYGLIHGYSKGAVWQVSDGGVYDPRLAFMNAYWLSRESKNYLTYHPAMYFGISYTFNPYRAITGVSALVTAYTEKSTGIRTTGISTPAGTMQVCNVSMQGYPINNAGIAYGYVHPNLPMAFYTNYDAKQKSDLEWMTDQETEIHDRYLMTVGPKKGMLPIKRDEILFQMTANPETPAGYVPLCDLRTPGDYSHPFNLALETTNFGSKYLYLYLSNSAGGRKGEAPNAHNVYHKKKYVAGVFCGSGSTPDEAIAHLYSQANKQWATLAKDYGDINANPVVMEFDEIIPDDLESKIPWYKMEVHDGVANCSLPSGEYLCSNDEAHNRWFYSTVNDYNKKVFDKAADREEWGPTCAYIGVVRTDSKPDGTKSPVYGLVKYYSDTTYTGEPTPPSTLKVGDTTCTLAGDPVIDWNAHKYYNLYYTTNKAGGAYSAPVTDIKISDEIFENGYNPTVVVRESQRVNYQLPQYYNLRKSAYEFRHIHLGYDRTDLPYIESIYIGVGKTKEEAYADLIGTAGAYAVCDVNCNYNSYSDQWVAIGYRRTSQAAYAITDVFLYYGDKPDDEVTFNDVTGYKTVSIGFGAHKKEKTTYSEGATYNLVKRALPAGGSENISLTQGNGSKGLYLYYTRTGICIDKGDPKQNILPIKNLCFSYGDISPTEKVKEEDYQTIYKNSYIGGKVFNASDFTNFKWECVLGVEGTPTNWNVDASTGRRMSLNEGIIPGKVNDEWHGSDNRVYMYVDRGSAYQIRPNAALPDFGYYSTKSDFGVLRQAG